MNIKDVLRTIGLGAFVAWLTQVDNVQARGLRGADGKAVTDGTDSQRLVPAVQEYGVSAEVSNTNTTQVSPVTAFELETQEFTITDDQVQSDEFWKKKNGNQTVSKFDGSISLPDDVAESDRRELVDLGNGVICLNRAFSPSIRDIISGNPIKFQLTDLIKGGKLESVDTVNPYVMLTFELERGGFLTAAIYYQETSEILDASSCHIGGVKLAKFSTIEATIFDSYTDRNGVVTPNVVRMSVSTGEYTSKSVLMKAPAKIKKLVSPWGFAPGIYNIQTGAVVTAAPESTAKPTPATSTETPSARTPVPTISTEDTSSPTAPTVSTVVGGTKGKDNNTANASTGGSDATGPVLGGIAAVGTVVGVAAYVHNKNKQDKNKQASQASDTQMVRAAATKLAQPKKQQYTKATAFSSNVESRSVPPIPVRPTTTTQSVSVQKTTENTANKAGVEEVPRGIVAKRLAEIKEKNKDNKP